ncbi:MAG: hypothetical protein H0V69_15065 [Acidimicrobiia bacterium]|jgi:hypothetical protein|nr:hypothetical protein [Acidimicrobiia bacterium]MDQ3390204.1 hypothetical protein [Actinomycetota bacterium]
MAALPIRSSGAHAVRPHPAALPNRRPTPHLTLVPARRRTAGLVLVASVILAVLMLGAAVLNTTLAERQVRVDELDEQVDAANARFEVLRGQRAELRSPGRLSETARALGMAPASSGAFVTVDPQTYAEVLAAFGSVDEANRIVATEQPLDQFRRVKQASGGPP